MGGSDASASKPPSTDPPVIGGWWSSAEHPMKGEVAWFREEIPATEQWARKNGDPQLRIAALELMGTLVLYKLIMKHKDHVYHEITTLKTDNKGNAHALGKHRTKKWPAADILMELLVTAHFEGMPPKIQHVKRDHNEWADQLTHHPPMLQGFDPDKRCRFDLEHPGNWYLWERLKHKAL